MKKLLMIFATVLLSVAAVSADEAQTRPWTAFSLGLFPGAPNITQRYDVRGLKLGIPMVDGPGRVDGVEASFLYSGTSYVNGFQGAWWGPAVARDIQGVQGSMSASVTRNFTGFQAGGCAISTEEAIGCQAGIAAVCRDFTGFQTGAVNIVYNKFSGFQFGAVNIANRKFDGACQIGAFNFVTKITDFDGFQIGVVNFSSHNGIQLGGINIIADSYVPVMIVFNCSFRAPRN